MRRHERVLAVIGITAALASVSCADIDEDAPGLGVSSGASGSIELEDPISPAPAPADELATPTPAGTTGNGATSSAACGEGASASATVVNVDEWVRLRDGPSLDAEEITLLPVDTTLTSWPKSLRFDGSDFWWVAARDPETGTCGYVAGYFLASGGSRLDSNLQGVSVSLPDGEWVLERQTSLGGPSWTNGGTTTISVAVTDDSIDSWVARVQEAVTAFVEAPEGSGFTAPTQWFTEVEVPGADRAVRPAVFPSDDGIAMTVIAEVGEKLVVVDSFRRHDPPTTHLIEPVDDFLTSLAIIDRTVITG